MFYLSVDDITAMDGYKKIIGIIEESHAYLKEARLEQAFEAAIFRGKRRFGQTITGFLASKKAAFSELKKQGLDLLETDAGNHLLGHLLLKQGGFTNDQQQRIRVLTDGSIDYRKVEIAIRKVFGDTLDETPAKSYWAEDWEDEEHASYFGDGDFGDLGGGLDFFDEYDPEGGQIYMVLDSDAPESLEETEAIEFMDDYLSWVFFEARDRFKGKGKGKSKGKPGKGHKGKSFGHGKGQKDGGYRPAPGTFGVYGSYMDHRRALQDARVGRGFEKSGDRRPRMSLEELKAKSRCHACRQIGHWSRNCPLKGRQPDRSRASQASSSQPSGQRPTAAMFFVQPPAHSASGYLTQNSHGPIAEQYMSEVQGDMTTSDFNGTALRANRRPRLCPGISLRTTSQPPLRFRGGHWWTQQHSTG